MLRIKYMKKFERFRKTGVFFLMIGIVLFCMMGCAEEQNDDLKNLSLDNKEDSLNDEDSVIEESTKEIQEEVPGKQEDSSAGIIYVYVCGAVEVPGVYELEAGARIYEALACAGGLREDADRNCVNQAQMLSDGEQVYIPTQEEARQNNLPIESSKEESGVMADGRVNINTATKEELMTLNGIGESRAESILAYRQNNGSFQCIEDLMNVDGIKEGVFQKIKDSITVNTGS